MKVVDVAACRILDLGVGSPRVCQPMSPSSTVRDMKVSLFTTDISERILRKRQLSQCHGDHVMRPRSWS